MSARKRGIIMLAALVSSMLIAAGCGMGHAGDSSASASAKATDSTAADKEQTAASESANSGSTSKPKSENLDALLGEWVRIASMGNEFYSTTEDIEYAGTMDIYVEDGYYKVDCIDNEYGYSEYYGVKLSEVSKPQYPGNDAADWYAQFARKNEPDVSYDIALLEKDILKLHIHSSASYQDEETGEEIEEVYDNYEVYVRKDSENIDDIMFKYRYTNTVNVSNIREFYEAIDNNTRIILEAGTYNISELPFEQRHNENVNYYNNEETWEHVYYNDDTISAKYINNLLIEAKEGEQVTICTEDPLEAPLSFQYCNNVTLSGLTVGHMVEPGYCSGSVILIDDSSKININDCRLYGCGTYGLEGTNSYGINVYDTEIYECSYGLISFYNTGNVTFKDCNMHDSREFDMICLQDCWNVLFDNCSITDNVVEYETNYLIKAIGDDISFKDCRFEGNYYNNFKNGNASLENCTISD